MSEYRMEQGMTQRQKWIWADKMEEFRTVRTGSGRKYRVRLTAEEIEEKRKLGMAAALGILTPAAMILMAWAWGIIG